MNRQANIHRKRIQHLKCRNAAFKSHFRGGEWEKIRFVFLCGNHFVAVNSKLLKPIRPSKKSKVWSAEKKLNSKNNKEKKSNQRSVLR